MSDTLRRPLSDLWINSPQEQSNPTNQVAVTVFHDQYSCFFYCGKTCRDCGSHFNPCLCKQTCAQALWEVN